MKSVRFGSVIDNPRYRPGAGRLTLSHIQAAAQNSPFSEGVFMYRCFVALVLACLPSLSLAQEAPMVVLVKVFAAPGRGDELNNLYLKRLNYLRKAEPEATFKLHRSVREPNVFVWYEVYPSQAAYENHLKVVMVDFRKEFGPTPEGIIAKPSESEVYTELGR